jgi:hypothetical protein
MHWKVCNYVGFLYPLNVSDITSEISFVAMFVSFFTCKQYFALPAPVAQSSSPSNRKAKREVCRRMCGSHSGGCEDITPSGGSQPTFRRNTSPPSSGLKSKRSKKLAWSRQQEGSIPGYGGTMFPETSGGFQQTTRRYIAGDRYLKKFTAAMLLLWLLKNVTSASVIVHSFTNL